MDQLIRLQGNYSLEEGQDQTDTSKVKLETQETN